MRVAALLTTAGVLFSCDLAEQGEANPFQDSGADAPWDGASDPDVGDAPSEALPEVSDDAFDAPQEDAEAGDAGEDALDAAETAACGGVAVGGFCWYASAPEKSCGETCLPHGGCDLAGTRDFAGSGGTDANCVLVLNALGFGSYPHQSYSNNDLGCQYAWQSWTYWSSALPTTCEAAGPGAASVVRMCACKL